MLLKLFYHFLPQDKDINNAILYSQFLIIGGSILAINNLVNKYVGSSLLGIACLVACPMLFAYQRLNITLIAFIGVLVFIIYLEDEKYRWLSLTGLILASSIKLYPAAYAFILLKKKRYVDL